MILQRKRGLLSLVISGGLFLLAAVPTIALAMPADVMVPLKGTFNGVGANFSGHVTHLGIFEGVIDNSATPPTAEWTAANGDSLANETASFVIDFANPTAPNVFPYTQTIVLTGGTGRFSQATGSATVVGTINVVTFEYDGLINGVISLPNSGD